MQVSHLIPRAGVALLACALYPIEAHAEGLQVAPVSVTISDRSGILTVLNEADKPLTAQVRVFRWNQDGGEDSLVPSDDLIASPPFAQIGPGGRQLVRLVRTAPGVNANAPCEEPFRVIVDEVPNVDTARKGLHYVVRHSVPVYLTNPGCADAKPHLTMHVVREGASAWLEVANSGQRRAQIAKISLVDGKGRRSELSPGLIGYVLAVARRRFALPETALDFTGGARVEALINGLQVDEPVSLAQTGQ
jgi:fimbrial chaperone protein